MSQGTPPLCTYAGMLGTEHEVLVVSPNSQWNWIPSDIWMCVGRMGVKDVTFPLAPVYRRQKTTFAQAKAVDIDVRGNEVMVSVGVPPVHPGVLAALADPAEALGTASAQEVGR